MKRLSCRCGRPVFFNNHSCAHCGRQLAFDSAALQMRAEDEPGSGLPACTNRYSAVRCNWLPVAGGGSGYCLSCRLSKTIPSLSKPENFERWRKLEAAKRRLIYDLLSLGLPVRDSQLRFEFKEDSRTNPLMNDQFVSTGHMAGVITVNAAEADEVFREKMRQQMNEPWRTLLGHLRHESGHYYFSLVIDAANRDEARALFGDETAHYQSALERYYRGGPAPDWHDRFISAYASAHPSEDWAECWAHYLHIRAVLETATAGGLLDADPISNWYDRFIELVVSLNEIMRSLGLPDAYPFVLTAPVARKIEFINRGVTQRYG
jgi:hypothetical protein